MKMTCPAQAVAEPNRSAIHNFRSYVKCSWAEASVDSRLGMNRRVRTREKDPFVAVVLPSNAIRRFAAVPFDFENYCVTVWHPDTTTPHDQSITYCCTHIASSRHPLLQTILPRKHRRIKGSQSVIRLFRDGIRSFGSPSSSRGFEPVSAPAGTSATSHGPTEPTISAGPLRRGHYKLGANARDHHLRASAS